MNSMNGQGKVSGAANSVEHEIKRYLKILRRRKWIVFVVALIIFPVWEAYVLLFQSHPVYTASVLLSLEEQQEVSAVARRGRRHDAAGKVNFLLANRLLSQVVEDLQLNLSLKEDNLSRNQLFAYVKTYKESVPGEYWVVRKNNLYQLHYSNEGVKGIAITNKVKNALLATFSPTDTVRINNFEFVINHDYLKGKKFKEIHFEIHMVQKVIENLKNIISYKLDQTSRTVMTVLVKHRSPEMAALIANTLAKRFVELNREVARYKSDKIMVILENQLKIAKQELDEATQKLRAFQEKYPWVRLSADAQMQIATITELEDTQQKLQNKIRDVRELLQRLEVSGQSLGLEEKLSLCNELITLLSSSGELAREQFEYPLASVFSTEYEKLTAERRDLLASYAPTHPVVKENEQQIFALLDKVKKGAQDYVNKLQQHLNTLSQDLQVERSKLRRLPATSLQYAELQREHDLKERVYSTVLVRYNQNKLESEVDISDVFIIDPAIPPPEQDVIFALIIKSLMGLLISVGIGFIVAVILEVFNKTAENVEELQEMLDIPVVGEIPLIKVEQGDGDGFQELRGKRDPKLITLDYSPTLASESYRDLRTKVLFMNQNENLSSLMVTSLRPDEGKSLTTANLAITVAQQKISTLLIDGDLRRGVLHNTFGNKKTPGLSDFLISSATVDFDNLSKLIQPTFIPNLFLITCGSPIPNPTEMLGGERFVAFLNLLRSRFGMVIMDTPPIQASSDAAILARYFDGVLTVIKAGSTDIEQLRQKLNEYPNLRKKVIGAVLNMVQVNTKKTQYQYSYYNY